MVASSQAPRVTKFNRSVRLDGRLFVLTVPRSCAQNVPWRKRRAARFLSPNPHRGWLLSERGRLPSFLTDAPALKPKRVALTQTRVDRRVGLKIDKLGLEEQQRPTGILKENTLSKQEPFAAWLCRLSYSGRTCFRPDNRPHFRRPCGRQHCHSRDYCQP